MRDLFNEFSDSELLLADIQFLSLNQLPWEWARGAKTERHYQDVDGNTCIKDTFSYEYDSDNRFITEMTRAIEWYNPDNTVGLTKNINVNLSSKKLKTLNREIRQGRLDYLETAAEELRALALTLPEPFQTQYTQVADSIDALFLHYDTEVLHYIQRGSIDFEDAVNNETDATILAILGIQVSPPDAQFPNGLTVKQSIMYQLKGDIP